ncbi:HNH endonuclease [Streptomyces sp. NPDC054802]
MSYITLLLHIHPRARGGSNRISNLTLACIPCNDDKGTKPVKEFLQDRPDHLAKVLQPYEAALWLPNR